MKNILLGLTIILFAGCEGKPGAIGETGATGLNSLVNITNQLPNENCENGGIKIDVGIDNNVNGTLDSNEILNTSYVCNGVDGNTSLTSVTTEAAGNNCDNGGVKIDSGIDANKNGVLDNNEITATAYICNGIDGINSLTKITNEAAGVNCETGGVKIDSGVDTNGNGILEDSEIVATAYACNGLDGNISLVNVTDEIAGENCENGGVKIESGIDNNGNGSLDKDEVTVTRFICNGLDGGFDEQIRLSIFSGDSGFATKGPPIIWKEFIDFDKRNYIGVDSIVFIPRLKADRSNNAVTVELYDLTNDRVINNTKISTNSTEIVTIKSPNIFSDLPEEKINLGIQISSENFVCESCFTGFFTGPTYLMLYRSN
ncbi:DUF7151 family protein [Polaribacter aquimarinus]|nr:hypothetical protein [Polaribacter aquimarinus]